MGVIVTNNQQLIEAPSAARRLRYGLFNASTQADMTRPVIASGLQFLVDHCGNDVQVYNQTCADSPTKAFASGSDTMETLPYWLVARKRCGTVGRTGEEMQAAVRQMLATGAQTRVEEMLWDGNGIAGVANLVNAPGVVTVVPAATGGAGAAIAALEEAFYSANGYVGTIHMNTAGYGAVRYARMVEYGVPGTPAGTLTTPLGSLWSIGAGYGIDGPGAVAPDAGSVYAFMTGPVTVWRSGVLPQPDPRQVLDRTLNQWDVVAEEVFAAVWDCPEVFAVQVPLAAPGVTVVA